MSTERLDTSRGGAINRSALFDLIASQRLFIYLAVTILSAAGIWSALKLPSAIYPELTFPRITIVAQGASLGARQVVFAVSRPIEEAVSIVPGVERVRSRSIRGSSEVNITFADGTDMANAVQLVRTRIEEIRSDLPPGLAIEIERLTPARCFRFYRTTWKAAIRPRCSTLHAIRSNRCFRACRELVVLMCRVRTRAKSKWSPTPHDLSNAGLTYDERRITINQAERITSDAVGRVAQDYKQYLVVSAQEAHSIDDVANVVVRPGIRVRDVATVASRH